jgi:cytochrome P450
MISGMIERGNQCDFVAEIGIWYPLRVVMEILGIPAEHDRLMLKLTQEMLGVEDSELGRERKSVFADDFLDVVRDFHSYFREVLAARRRNPGDDVASVIANAEIDGQLIDDASVLGYYTAIATAGHDTTSSSTASAVWALANYPEEFRRVKADRSQIPTLVNEAIRWSTPVQHFMRSATADCEILGRPIAKGDWLMLNYFSGNRDEEVFGDPFTFRGNRDPNPHLSFGYGVHLCLGMNLARLEIKILLEELLDRIEHIELAGTVRRSESLFIAGLKTLPVNYRAS